MNARQRILIIEDDTDLSELVAMYLDKECFETRIENDGAEAVKAFREFMPDLILLDGGMTHVKTVREVAERYGVDIPVFGMVKDDYHKTRALVSDIDEISIARDPSLFRFIYKLQEEVHRFTISKMKAAKLKTIKTGLQFQEEDLIMRLQPCFRENRS